MMKRIWKLGWLPKFAFCAGLVIPIDSLDSWKSLKFNKIPAHKVSVEEGSLKINVRKSSSPLIYKFKKPRRVKGFKLKAKWKGKFKIPEGQVQGAQGADDFLLKFGLVEKGTQKLSWFQKKVAADWVLELYKLAPRGTGVKKINFYTTTVQAEQMNKKRVHPLSELLHEERIHLVKKEGEIVLEKTFDQPIESLGIWLSTDGDDTGSEFELMITDMSVL